jgi:radical SAM superfamily enzyme YgiQ (UPF0313 family)
VDTGIQRLVGNLDELPHPVLGYRLLERPSRRTTLASQALPSSEVRRVAPIVAQVMTFGCKFSCEYCPIPAYNQRQYRTKSGRQLADEMSALHVEYGLKYFFGTDDNFFNDRERTLDILDTFVNMEIEGKPFRRKIRWATEATVHDTLKMKDDLRLARRAGVNALWLGVEDMSGILVKKGQSEEKTLAAFRALTDHGILPMPMMMHHDDQPLWTWGSSAGLLNQVRLLRKAGAVSMQVLMITPAVGSRMYEDAFTSGHLYESLGTRRVEGYMLDGNYVAASDHKKPWVQQFHLLVTYLYFYNPFRFIIAAVRPKSSLCLKDAGMQVIGMFGLIQTIRHTFGWMVRLMVCKVKRRSEVPFSPIPMRSPDGSPASHALPGTVLAGDASADHE